MSGPLKVGVMGAGAIGCYVGGHLAARGVDVVFVGRAAAQEELRRHGLTVTDLSGRSAHVPPSALRFETEAPALADRDVVLCCVKSAHSSEAGAELSRVLRPGAVVVSLQNGVRNGDLLRAQLPRQVVLGGIVGWNVVGKGEGVFRQTTSGLLVLEALGAGQPAAPLAQALSEALAACGFSLERPADLRAKQWTKLLMNLSNALGALAAGSTRELLFQAGYRRLIAALLAESLAVLRAAGIRPARLGPLPIQIFPLALRLPSPVVRLLLRAQLRVDAEARSSMWQDLSRRRRTEVDQLNGEILRLSAETGVPAPLNARLVALVHEAEERGAGPPALSAEALWRALGAP